MMRRRTGWAFGIGLFMASFLAACASDDAVTEERFGKAEYALSSGIRISQVFGGGQSTSTSNPPPYRYDYVELFNGGQTPVDVAGWTIQFAGTSTAFSSLNLNVIQLSGGGGRSSIIPPGGYYLVQLGTVGTSAGAVDLPTPDAIGVFDITQSNGKVALVSDALVLPLSCTTGCATAFGVVDFVGYGTANDSETAAAPAASSNLAATRKNGGCTETDNNASDFQSIAPNPHNSRSVPNPCAGGGVDGGGAVDGGSSSDGGGSSDDGGLILPDGGGTSDGGGNDLDGGSASDGAGSGEDGGGTNPTDGGGIFDGGDPPADGGGNDVDGGGDLDGGLPLDDGGFVLPDSGGSTDGGSSSGDDAGGVRDSGSSGGDAGGVRDSGSSGGDASSGTDAGGVRDSGSSGGDASAADSGGARDSGTGGTDSGSSGTDSGTGGTDSGTSGTDSGTTGNDAGSSGSIVDAGRDAAAARDAGRDAGDGGSDIDVIPGQDSGCSCSEVKSTATTRSDATLVFGAMAMVGVCVTRRRRRHG
ncbi:MAG: lamin tail domain-containing protein [Polyangiaceae bacterium]